MAQKIFSINSEENFCNIKEISIKVKESYRTPNGLGNKVPQNMITIKNLNTEYKL